MGKTGVLLKDEFRSFIVDGHESCFGMASYDLRLGADYVLPGDIDPKTGRSRSRSCEDNRDGALTIKAFSSVIVSTHETLNMPANAVGRFDLKIRQAAKGLMVQMGPQVEPFYQGKLYALVHNITDQPILLRHKSAETKIFTIEFHYTSDEVAKPPQAELDLKNNKSMVEFLGNVAFNRTFDSIQADTNKRIKKIRSMVRSNSVWFALLAGFAVTGLAPIIIGQTFNWLPISDLTLRKEAAEAKITADGAKMKTDLQYEELRRLREMLEDVRKRANEDLQQANRQIKELSDRIDTLSKPRNTP